MFNQAKAIVNMLKFSQDVYNTGFIFKFHDAILALAPAADRLEASARLLEDEQAARLYSAENREVYLFDPFELVKLRQCAPGTLGHSYAAMMDAAGLDPEFFAYMDVTDPVSFFVLRSRKTHDLHHVVTGFSTDKSGEVGLQGYYLGQMGSALPLSIVASAFIGLMRQKTPEIEKALAAFVAGYHLGKQSAPFHGIFWEDLWDEQVSEIRRRMRIDPVATGELDRTAAKTAA